MQFRELEVAFGEHQSGFRASQAVPEVDGGLLGFQAGGYQPALCTLEVQQRVDAGVVGLAAQASKTEVGPHIPAAQVGSRRWGRVGTRERVPSCDVAGNRQLRGGNLRFGGGQPGSGRDHAGHVLGSLDGIVSGQDTLGKPEAREPKTGEQQTRDDAKQGTKRPCRTVFPVKVML